MVGVRGQDLSSSSSTKATSAASSPARISPPVTLPVMVLGGIRGAQGLAGPYHLAQRHLQTGLLPDLAERRVSEAFAVADLPTGYGPRAGQDAPAPLHQQHPALVHHHHAHADQRRSAVAHDSAGGR